MDSTIYTFTALIVIAIGLIVIAIGFLSFIQCGDIIDCISANMTQSALKHFANGNTEPLFRLLRKPSLLQKLILQMNGCSYTMTAGLCVDSLISNFSHEQFMNFAIFILKISPESKISTSDFIRQAKIWWHELSKEEKTQLKNVQRP